MSCFVPRPETRAHLQAKEYEEAELPTPSFKLFRRRHHHTNPSSGRLKGLGFWKPVPGVVSNRQLKHTEDPLCCVIDQSRGNRPDAISRADLPANSHALGRITPDDLQRQERHARGKSYNPHNKERGREIVRAIFKTKCDAQDADNDQHHPTEFLQQKKRTVSSVRRHVEPPAFSTMVARLS